MRKDAINPSHYKKGGIECIDVLEAMGIAEHFCLGNAIKYLYRAGDKDDEVQDLKKAEWYLQRLISIKEKQ